LEIGNGILELRKEWNKIGKMPRQLELRNANGIKFLKIMNQ